VLAVNENPTRLRSCVTTGILRLIEVHGAGSHRWQGTPLAQYAKHGAGRLPSLTARNRQRRSRRDFGTFPSQPKRKSSNAVGVNIDRARPEKINVVADFGFTVRRPAARRAAMKSRLAGIVTRVERSRGLVASRKGAIQLSCAGISPYCTHTDMNDTLTAGLAEAINARVSRQRPGSASFGAAGCRGLTVLPPPRDLVRF